MYLIGRVVVFQDPHLARARPDLAVRTPGGGIWATSAGLAWVNPYDRRVWDYAVSVAAAAARAGFDEIMLDYVRFPTDGDVGAAVYPGKTRERRARSSPRSSPTRSSGSRRSASVSRPPCSASPRRGTWGSGRFPPGSRSTSTTSTRWPYPYLYGGGELGIVTPSAEPGETVFRTLVDFKRQLKGSNAQLIPWIQDWSYDREQVLQQVRATRLQGAKGFLLWNPYGLYTKAALSPPS